MANWFKFYGGEFLYDPKIINLNSAERSCWVILLCHASVSSIPGEIKHLSEDMIILSAGIDFSDDQFEKTRGILKKLEKLEMIKVENDGIIVVRNFRKRQDTALTSYERVKKHREKKIEESKGNEKKREKRKGNERITLEENRREENRREEIIIKREIQTPSQVAKDFFSKEDRQTELIEALTSKYGQKDFFLKEIQKFIEYWTEPNKSGTKQRWELQSTFEVSRRIKNWLNRSKQYGMMLKDEKKGVSI